VFFFIGVSFRENLGCANMKKIYVSVGLLILSVMTTEVNATMLSETNVSVGISEVSYIRSEFRHFWYPALTTWTEFEINEDSIDVYGLVGYRDKWSIRGVRGYSEILAGGAYMRGYETEDEISGVLRFSAGVSLDGYKNYMEIKGDKIFKSIESNGSIKVGFDLLDHRNYGLHSYQFGVFKVFGPEYFGIYIGLGI
jgi:hypothetical protein